MACLVLRKAFSNLFLQTLTVPALQQEGKRVLGRGGLAARLMSHVAKWQTALLGRLAANVRSPLFLSCTHSLLELNLLEKLEGEARAAYAERAPGQAGGGTLGEAAVHGAVAVLQSMRRRWRREQRREGEGEGEGEASSPADPGSDPAQISVGEHGPVGAETWMKLRINISFLLLRLAAWLPCAQAPPPAATGRSRRQQQPAGSSREDQALPAFLAAVSAAADTVHSVYDQEEGLTSSAAARRAQGLTGLLLDAVNGFFEFAEGQPWVAAHTAGICQLAEALVRLVPKMSAAAPGSADSDYGQALSLAGSLLELARSGGAGTLGRAAAAAALPAALGAAASAAKLAHILSRLPEAQAQSFREEARLMRMSKASPGIMYFQSAPQFVGAMLADAVRVAGSLLSAAQQPARQGEEAHAAGPDLERCE